MTRPKEAHPGQLAMLTRRTTQRRYFFPPGSETRELFGYMAVKAALDHDLGLVVASLMTNHVHVMVLDNHGNRSDWMRQAFSTVARKQNLRLNRRENLWSQEKPGDMPILDIDKVVEQVLYVALQPVKAGLVRRADEWTGFTILPKHWGKPMRFERPPECGPELPEFVEFTPMPPPGFEHLPLADVIAFFEAKIAEGERRIYNKRRGRKVVGIKRCERINPYSTPTSDAAMRTRNPRFTTSDPARRRAAEEQLERFREEHRNALNDFRDGDRETIFPAGTIQMARLAGCCRAASTLDHPLALNIDWTHRLQYDWDTWLAMR